MLLLFVSYSDIQVIMSNKIFLIILYFSYSTTNAYQCYSCKSAVDIGMDLKEEKWYDELIANLSAIDYRPDMRENCQKKSNDFHRNPCLGLCAKTEHPIKDSDKPYVTRYCTDRSREIMKYDQKCYGTLQTGGIVCYCKGELCNSAKFLQLYSSLITFGLCILMLLF